MFVGYGENVLTFIADSSLMEAGQFVKIVESGTVGKCEVGDRFCGLCLAVRDGFAAVQIEGFAVAKTKSKIPIGYQCLVAGEKEHVISRPHGREYLVVTSGDNEVGFIM